MMNPLQQLRTYGQSFWLDYMRRNLITSGELDRLITDDGLGGMTSNPTIFEQAIDGSHDYDESISTLLAATPDLSPLALFEALACEDIRRAADALRPVYEATGSVDGFVSFEVAPHLAHDTDGTIRDARRLFKALDRPNVLIKVPATREGMPAIEALTAEGVNVNITLIFSVKQYEEVVAAFLRGIARAREPESITSVASLFVSRVDTVVDRTLEALGSPEALALRGKVAIANAKTAYGRFRQIFYGEAFAAARARQVRVQRPLWGSTGTKNKAYSDVLYVEELIGPDTVNTIPPATADAFRDHGRPRASLEEGLDEAPRLLERLAGLGIDLDHVCDQLLVDGVAAFAKSYDALMAALQKKIAAVAACAADRQTLDLGRYQQAVSDRLEAWQQAGFGRRLWAGDPTLWSAKPVSELANRLGWLGLHETPDRELDGVVQFADEAVRDGFEHVVLLGMGGSSLAPEVFQATFGNAAARPALLVLDSTHPLAVKTVAGQVNPGRTLFLVSSKSGTTLESLSFFRYFWARTAEATTTPGRHFVAITDPGTPLERLAHERGFRRVFQGPPEVGGRYSALSVFGTVPAALIGVDLHQLMARAANMARAASPSFADSGNPALTLGAALGELAMADLDKVTFFTSPRLAAFPAWLEQLIAESTGKNGKGIVPVVDEPAGTPAVYARDRFFVWLAEDGDRDAGVTSTMDALRAAGFPTARISLSDPYDLGQEILRWELAVAAAGAALGIQPFDQPDVQLAKDLARKAMAQAVSAGAAAPGGANPVAARDGERLRGEIRQLLKTARPGDYFSIQAYLAPTDQTTAAMQALRTAVRDPLHLATTAGYGPRFLHSTGQLHKGGPDSGIFLQLIDEPQDEVAVPETDFSFGAVVRAQALGDYAALQQRGRRVLRVNLGGDVAAGLAGLLDAWNSR